jgi:Asp-tRNA(Asn)/Glu-tRNA(Gln) amidotransferase A subunit family amidase
MSVLEESTVGQHTTDNPTTVGALAFEALVPPYEAAITKTLRDAGAVV